MHIKGNCQKPWLSEVLGRLGQFVPNIDYTEKGILNQHIKHIIQNEYCLKQKYITQNPWNMIKLISADMKLFYIHWIRFNKQNFK